METVLAITARVVMMGALCMCVWVCVGFSHHEDTVVRWASRMTPFPMALQAGVLLWLVLSGSESVTGWLRPITATALALAFAGIGVLASRLGKELLRREQRSIQWKLGLAIDQRERIEELVRKGRLGE